MNNVSVVRVTRIMAVQGIHMPLENLTAASTFTYHNPVIGFDKGISKQVIVSIVSSLESVMPM